MDNPTLTDKQHAILKLPPDFDFSPAPTFNTYSNDRNTRLTNYHLKILTSQNYIMTLHPFTWIREPTSYLFSCLQVVSKVLQNIEGIKTKNTPTNLSRKNQISTKFIPTPYYRPIFINISPLNQPNQNTRFISSPKQIY